MSLPIIAIRPQPGLAATLDHARALGLEIFGEPMFQIRAVDWQAPDLASIDALLIGSANAIRHGGDQLRAFCTKPVHAVGNVTAQAAQEAGFTVANVGNGGLQSLLDGLPRKPLRFLRLAGAERVVLAAPQDVWIEERIVYESAALAMPGSVEKQLRRGAIALLHSAAAARHLAAECARLAVPAQGIALAAFGPRIGAAATAAAKAAGIGEWAQIRYCQPSSEAALLALAKDMCQGN